LASAARIGVVGATGAVGTVTLELLAARGYENVRAFASASSAGLTLPYYGSDLKVEETSPEVLASGELDLCFFSVGTRLSRELVPRARDGGALCVDKSSAYRLVDGIPLVVPEVNGGRVLEHDGIVANPNCCAIPLTLALKPLHEEAGLARVRVATYQSVSGAGKRRMEELRSEGVDAHNVVMDWTFEGYGDETEEESKLRDETRKILELPELPISATCVRVPVLVGHSEAVWAEFEQPLSAERAAEVLGAAPSLRVVELPTPKEAAGRDDVLVGRIRPDRSAENGIAFFLAGDNLRKGAALNAVQIAELMLTHDRVAA
jgi:aspartate-semialdehyde dehydrogenase